MGGNSLGAPGLLTVIFVVLKLAGIVDWSWWLVLVPYLTFIAAFIGVTLLMRSGRKRQSA